MKRLLLIIFAAVMAVTANAQKKVVVEHSYSSFDAVQAEDWFSISFSRSEEYGVRITTEASVEDYIIAYAKEGVLYLVVDEKAMPADVRKMFKAKNPVLAMPRVEIFAPEIKDVRGCVKACFQPRRREHGSQHIGDRAFPVGSRDMYRNIFPVRMAGQLVKKDHIVQSWLVCLPAHVLKRRKTHKKPVYHCIIFFVRIFHNYLKPSVPTQK